MTGSSFRAAEPTPYVRWMIPAPAALLANLAAATVLAYLRNAKEWFATIPRHQAAKAQILCWGTNLRETALRKAAYTRAKLKPVLRAAQTGPVREQPV